MTNSASANGKFVPPLSRRTAAGSRRRCSVDRIGPVLATLVVATLAAARPASAQVFVANLSGDSLSVLDPNENSLLAVVPAADDPDGLAVSPDGRRLLVSRFLSNELSWLDTDTRATLATIPVGQGPVGVAFAPDGRRAAVTNRKDDTLGIVDPGAGIVSANVAVGDAPNSVAIDPSGNAWVTNSATKAPGTVSVVDMAGAAVVGTVEVARNPSRIALSPDGKTAYVTNYRSWNVSVIDTAARRVTATLRVGGRPSAVAVHPNGALAYVGTQSGSLHVVDVAGNRVLSVVEVGGRLFGLATNVIGSKAWLVRFDQASVAVVDLVDERVVAEVPVEAGPFAIAFGCTGSGCDAPPLTPWPTRTPTSIPTFPPDHMAAPTVTRAPTEPPLRTSTPRATPTPAGPEDVVHIAVGSAEVPAGGWATITVSLQGVRNDVAGTQNDILFDNTKLSLSSGDCRIEAAIGQNHPGCENDPQEGPCKAFNKNLVQCGGDPQPSGCPADAGANLSRFRGIVVATGNTNVIPSGVLYRCAFKLKATGGPAGETIPLTCAEAHSSDAGGRALPTGSRDGQVVVGAASVVSSRSESRADRSELVEGSLRCSAGRRDGEVCRFDDDCLPDGVCVSTRGVCDGGGDDGLLCDCPEGHCVAPAGSDLGTCSGGTADGASCDRSFTCSGGASCVATRLLCAGGAARGLPCVRAAQCQGSACVATGKRCLGGEFDAVACIDDRDCSLGRCVDPLDVWRLLHPAGMKPTVGPTPVFGPHDPPDAPTASPSHTPTAWVTATRAVSPSAPETPSPTPSPVAEAESNSNSHGASGGGCAVTTKGRGSALAWPAGVAIWLAIAFARRRRGAREGRSRRPQA